MSGFVGSPIEGESYTVAQIISMMMAMPSVLIGAGETNLELSNLPFNIVYISATDAETISSISVNSDDYVVLIIARDNNITIQSNAQIDLNSLPAGTDFAMVQHDILALICKEGVYQEIFRTEKN